MKVYIIRIHKNILTRRHEIKKYGETMIFFISEEIK